MREYIFFQKIVLPNAHKYENTVAVLRTTRQTATKDLIWQT